MQRALLLSVRFHEGRYHGAGGWPPAPARLFQALVAAAARGQLLAEDDRAALAWLESLAPPRISAPAIRVGQSFRNYVPNNDLDAVGGDIRRIGEVRASKAVRPLLFDRDVPLRYVWNFNAGTEGTSHAEAIVRIAAQLYQLGRGPDQAWASAEVVDEEAAEEDVLSHDAPTYRPTKGRAGEMLLCPLPGSLKSLEERFQASRKRFAHIGSGRKQGLLFSQPPKPRFQSVSYNAPSDYLLFDLRETISGKADPDFAPWPLADAAALVVLIRDAVASRLTAAFGAKADLIARVIVGRGASEADKAQRVRIIPLPSIGHIHVDRAIRRVLVVVPPNSPIDASDIAWAVSGLGLGIDLDTGAVLRADSPVLTPARDSRVLRRYGVGQPGRLWRTVTPAALPEAAVRRRIEPSRLRERDEWKGAEERLQEERRASASIVQALRHAGVSAKSTTIRVQREPFSARGARAEAFASGSRFAKERLWHVEIALAEAVAGPLVLGDGRYLGFGLMERIREAPRDVVTYSLPLAAGIDLADRSDLLHAVRRALMGLSRRPDGTVPMLFSGHEAEGGAARSGRHRHVFVACADLDGDRRIDHLIVAAPWACDRSVERNSREAALFERVLSGFELLRANRLGVIPLRLSSVERKVMGAARDWESHTAYRPTRHTGRSGEPATALLRDVIVECERRGLPRPQVELVHLDIGPKGGIAGRLRLRFAVSVAGPILLGRDSHKGGGLFLVRE